MNALLRYGAAVVVGMLLAAVPLSWRHDAALAKLERQQATNLANATQAARDREHELQLEIENVRNDNQALRDLAQRDAAGAAAVAGGLRDKLAAANSRAATEATRAGRALDENARIATELRNVVGMCATEYQRLGEVADGLRGDLTGLQAWVRVIQQGNGLSSPQYQAVPRAYKQDSNQ